jgi:putative transposase
MDRQVYYRAKKAKAKYSAIASKVVEMVKAIRERMPRLGTRKLYEKLKAKLQLLGVGRDRLFEILRANHLLIKQKRQYRVTTDSHHRFSKHKNLVEELEIIRPEQVFVSDITYIGERDNPMYLSLITDGYSKKVMGHNVSDSLAATGAMAALERALRNRKYKKSPLIHHSDRGVQYCGDDYQQLLKKNQVMCSMTEQYDPYQNAVAERVNGIIKQEFLGGIIVNDIKLMKKIVAESIEIYNQERPHLSCHMLTPEQMHQQQKLKMKTYRKKKSTEKIPVLHI